MNLKKRKHDWEIVFSKTEPGLQVGGNRGYKYVDKANRRQNQNSETKYQHYFIDSSRFDIYIFKLRSFKNNEQNGIQIELNEKVYKD